MVTSNLETQLDRYYQQINSIILSRQNPISGLLPASTAVNAHGDYTDAWVRDNVYSILAVWGLGLAYRKIDQDQGRTFELEHAVVKLMRGLLFAMMRQAPKVEAFKNSQAPLDALHAKYDTSTGATVVADDGWGHLQLDATSIFLLLLAQMTASGLAIIFTQDEVDFIQNLVYYIGRTYRTPDYGIWERGNKINHGNPELNASSIGMAKAALEAMSGLNLFGLKGTEASVIHVLPDEIARCRITLRSLLPRESSSKEVDASLLSVIGYPAFAIEEVEVADRTRQKIIDLLQGEYGCKRFLRDGHQTVLEDTRRLHYLPTELKQFEHIECEWPLFFTYLALDGWFRGDRDQANLYLEKLDKLAVERDGLKLLPELYYVAADRVEAEKANPGSQPRLPNENLPLVWAQSLYFLAQMLQDGLLQVDDIDPLGGHKRIGNSRRATVQIALLAEDEALQRRLETRNIATQTLDQIAPIQVRQARELSQAYGQLGRNAKLGLSGRPQRLMRSLATSKVFRIQGETIVFLPAFLDREKFYLTLDYHFLVAKIISEIAYVNRNWRQLGRPIMTLLLTHDMLDMGQDALLKLVQACQDGLCGEVPVKLGTLSQLMLTASRSQLDFLPSFEAAAPVLRAPYLSHDPAQTVPLSSLQEFMLEQETDVRRLVSRLQRSRNLYEQVEILSGLTRLQGLNFDIQADPKTLSPALKATSQVESSIVSPPQTTSENAVSENYKSIENDIVETVINEHIIREKSITVGRLLDEVYTKASQGDAPAEKPGLPYWGIVRQAAGLLDKVDSGISDAVTDIIVRQKQISVGRAYSEASLFTQPLPQTEVLDKIRNFCREDIRDRVLTQEILIYLSLLIKAEPALFKNLLTLRVGYLIILLTSDLAQARGVPQDEAYETLMQLPPFDIQTRLRQILVGYDSHNQSLFKQESLHLKTQATKIDWVVPTTIEGSENADRAEAIQDWLRLRQIDGAKGAVPSDFYSSVWKLLNHCKGLVIGDKLERRNRLESEALLSEMTPEETNFALQVEHLLNKIQAPEYRQVNVEALMELAVIAQSNPDLKIQEYIVLDVLVGHAVRLAWLEQYPEHEYTYAEHKATAWRAFYSSSPYDCASFIAKALQFLTLLSQAAAVA